MRLVLRPRDLVVTKLVGYPATVRLGDVAGEALETLDLAVGALSDAGATAWVTYGTLLGLVREGRLLAHDTDIDLAVMAGSGGRRIIDAMVRRGLTHMLEERRGGALNKLKFVRGRVVIDLWFVFDEGEVWADYCALMRRSVLRSTHLPVTIEHRELGGMRVPVPRDAEAYLEHLYGRGWRTPVERWNWFISPPNAEAIVHWRDFPRFAERYLRFKFKR
jgi:hypothetical protein